MKWVAGHEMDCRVLSHHRWQFRLVISIVGAQFDIAKRNHVHGEYGNGRATGA